MRQILPLLLVPVVVILSGQSSDELERGTYSYPGFVTGNKFIELSASERKIYVVGASDALLGCSLWGASTETALSLGKIMNTKTADQLLAVVEKYLSEHPANRDWAMNFIIYLSYVEAWPELKSTISWTDKPQALSPKSN